MGSGMLARCALAAAAVAVAALTLVAGASAGVQQTGTLVVRLVTDPAPPGASWTYVRVGTPFELGASVTEQSVSLQPGTYQLSEAPTQAGQADRNDRPSWAMHQSHT